MKSVEQLIHAYGSPLYVYDEKTLRDRCARVKAFCAETGAEAFYSAKANSNIALMRIIRSEGFKVDAMSPGELFLEQQAGFKPEEILFLTNNTTREVFAQVADRQIKVCVDAVSQLKVYCEAAPGSPVYIRLNVGKGAGHSEKVVTVGAVKFGIDSHQIDEAFRVAENAGCKITGFVVHIGSSFHSFEAYHQTVLELLELARKYPGVEHLDFGGGFAIPYDRANESGFPFEEYAPVFSAAVNEWRHAQGRNISVAVEPGRYLTAECGVCLARVMSVKNNYGTDFVGCDLGFGTLLRPALYDAYHEIVNASREGGESAAFHVTGNLCESGDVLGRDRKLPADTAEGDVLMICDTGAYGFSMSGNYNSFGRPAEILIDLNGNPKLIRKAEPLEQLTKFQIY